MSRKDITAEDIIELVKSRMEPSEPQNTILEILKKHDGKPLTVRHIDEMKKATGDDSIRLKRQFGMTQIEWGGYGGSQGTKGGELLVAYSERSVIIDAKHIEAQNCAYFSAAIERNTHRMKAICDVGSAANLAAAINLLHNARKVIDELSGYDAIFGDDRYAIEKAFVE